MTARLTSFDRRRFLNIAILGPVAICIGFVYVLVTRKLEGATEGLLAADIAWDGAAAFGISTAGLAGLLWLTVGDPGRPLAGGKKVLMNDRDPEANQPQDASFLELARLTGAVHSMARALDDAEDARKSERRDGDVLEGRLRRSQVGAAVRQLTDAMAHEIGSPLNTILGRARLSAANPDCPADIRMALETIALQAERISKLVADMLRVTRADRLQTGACDLAAIAAKVLRAIGPACERANVPVTLELETDSAYVKVDEERAFQIVVNACLSAVEAQPEGGNVKLRIRTEARDPIAPVKRVLFEVEDRGPPLAQVHGEGLSGISSAIDARGFGLMIARGLVVEAGGLFELREGAQGGAICQFTFPGGAAASVSP